MNMKRSIAIVLILFLLCTLTACQSIDDSGTTYSAHLDCDTFYNIAATSSVLPTSPMITSDEGNLGDVYIRVLDDKGQIICDSILVAPGETITLSEISVFYGTCTIQGKADTVIGEYTFYVP